MLLEVIADLHPLVNGMGDRQTVTSALDRVLKQSHGWCLGGEHFRRELLAAVNGKRSQWHYGEELQESAEAKAERLRAAELGRTGWREEDLPVRRQGRPVKVRLAARLRAETTVTMEWMAKRLHKGARGYLTHLLNRHDQKNAE